MDILAPLAVQLSPDKRKSSPVMGSDSAQGRRPDEEITVIKQLDVLGDPPSKADLKRLNERCKTAHRKLRSEQSEVRLPLFIEFSGSPKTGKSTIIGIVSHFLNRNNVSVAQPPEGASLRTPSRLKDDWLAFNAWSGCYALQNILVDCFQDPPVDVVLLDRGLFDFAAWMEFLYTHEKRITADDHKRAVEFFMIDLWRRRENAVFLFTADHKTSLKREHNCKLTTAGGSMMEAEKLANLLQSYEETARQIGGHFCHVFRIDTSIRSEGRPDFQKIAFVVAERIVEIIDDLGTQNILMIEAVDFEGFNRDPEKIEATCRSILKDGRPSFMPREKAEEAEKFQQVVPYALLKNDQGRYFLARRRPDSSRDVLRRKLTCLVGGHAEQRDWDSGAPEGVFTRCLERELEEELVGINIRSMKPLGFISDRRTHVGTLHLAYVFEVEIGGNVGIRRQAIDREFGREALDWVDKSSLCQKVADLDPWSQLVAAELFGATLPPSDQLFD